MHVILPHWNCHFLSTNFLPIFKEASSCYHHFYAAKCDVNPPPFDITLEEMFLFHIMVLKVDHSQHDALKEDQKV
jgi:hypothetical protein